MALYLDPKNDLIFKRIFGEHPHLLISFLNAIMPFEEGKFIEEINYLPAEQVPDILGKKNSIVDVKCTDNNKNQFIVEMQMFWSESFNNRMVFNAGKAYVRQLNKNQDYNLLKPVYTLAIINDIFDHKTEEFYHYYQIINRENTEEVIKGLSFVLVELPKFQPQSWSDRKLAALWLRFLNEVDENLKKLPLELEENENISQAAELCQIAAFSTEELEIYEAYWDAIRMEKTIRNASLQEGEAKGRAEGRAEGRVEGRAEGRAEGEAIGEKKAAINFAIKLAQKGISKQEISEMTGLTVQELTELLINNC